MDSAASQSPVAQALAGAESSKIPLLQTASLQLMAIIVFGAASLAYLSKGCFKDSNKFPVINPAGWFEIVGSERRRRWMELGYAYVEQGANKFRGKPFKVVHHSGEMTIFPTEWAQDIRNEPNAQFMKFIHSEFHADYAPFLPFASGTSDDALLQSVARKQLTKYLNKVTLPLSKETAYALDINFGTISEWNEINPLQPLLLDTVARISSCVFLGSQLCRDETWLRITKAYTGISFRAAEQLRLYPKWLRGIMSRTLSLCKQALAMIEAGRSTIGPVVEERRRLTREGLYKPSNTDAIDWFEEEAAGRSYDPTMCQLILSTAAIHTTTSLANETLHRLASNTQLVQDLRQELISVLRTDGWKKTGLFNMKLLDSTIKETQRLAQGSVVMRRMLTDQVRLPDGSVLHKGETFGVSTAGRMDPAFYDNPLEFDPYRFVRFRDTPDKANLAHLVSTGPQHLGFGHGKHACPGRFFAANELKVLLCHIILKYDMDLPEGYKPKVRTSGISFVSDPASRIRLKSRTPEVDLDNLAE